MVKPMRILLLVALAISVTGCSSTYQNQSYGEIAADAFTEGFLPARNWYQTVGQQAGRGVMPAR
jgi:hypothetical protein